MVLPGFSDMFGSDLRTVCFSLLDRRFPRFSLSEGLQDGIDFQAKVPDGPIDFQAKVPDGAMSSESRFLEANTRPRRAKTRQDAPRRLQDAPRTRQDAPKTRPRRAQDAPRQAKTAEDTPKTRLRPFLNRFLMDLK